MKVIEESDYSKKLIFHFRHKWVNCNDTGKHIYEECSKCEKRRILERTVGITAWLEGSVAQPIKRSWLREHGPAKMSSQDKYQCELNSEKSKREVAEAMNDTHWLKDEIGVFRSLGPAWAYPPFLIKMPNIPKQYKVENIINAIFMEAVKVQDLCLQGIREKKAKHGKKSKEYMTAVYQHSSARNATRSMQLKIEELIRAGILKRKDFYDKREMDRTDKEYPDFGKQRDEAAVKAHTRDVPLKKEPKNDKKIA